MNRRVFITGGAHGIGHVIACAFVNEGDKVAFCDIDSELGEKTAKELGCDFFMVDVRDKDALEGCMEQLFEKWGDIDIIINNVGISRFTPITETGIEDFDNVIATNLRPVFITSRLMAIRRKENGNKTYGRIINMCSSRYLMSEAGTEGYSASKGGIFSLTHALSISLQPYGICVNAIAPGWIHTDENEVLRKEDDDFHPSGRVGRPEDIASMCVYLSREDSDFINGQTITIDGGVTRKMIYPE